MPRFATVVWRGVYVLAVARRREVLYTAARSERRRAAGEGHQRYAAYARRVMLRRRLHAARVALVRAAAKRKRQPAVCAIRRAGRVPRVREDGQEGGEGVAHGARAGARGEMRGYRQKVLEGVPNGSACRVM